MPLPKTNIYTIDDIYALPEGQRAELIDGQIYNLAPPNRIHQEIITQLVKSIGQKIDQNNSFCKIYPAPFAVFLNADNKTYVEPDISVICDQDKLDDKGCNGAPDWIIEIISPSTQRMDYLVKLLKYKSAGVREYWIINPIIETVNVYFFDDNEKKEDAALFSFKDEIPVHIYEDFTINISELLKQ